VKLRAALTALAAGLALAGCSSSSPPSAPVSSPVPPVGATQSAEGRTAVHWWSATDYCGILRDTLRAGHSILPGAKAGDPALLTATKGFVASITAAAPSAIRGQWQVLGPAVIQLVESGGMASQMSGVNTRLVAQAGAAIAADAKTRCHLDISS
jgi:hypothetical protein